MKEPAPEGEGVEQGEKKREASAVGEWDSEASRGIAEAKGHERAVLVQDPFLPCEVRGFKSKHGTGAIHLAPCLVDEESKVMVLGQGSSKDFPPADPLECRSFDSHAGAGQKIQMPG